jgi:hypothetical protein
MHTKTRSTVSIEVTPSSSFSVNLKGLKEGDILSPILFSLPLQKLIPSIKMVPSGTKVRKEKLNVLA